MTIRYLIGNAEVVTILNRYGHGQSYARTLELETAMCNSVTSSESVLPRTISRDNNAVLHYVTTILISMRKLHQFGNNTLYPWHSYSGGAGSRQVCTFDGNKHCPQIEKPVYYTYIG